jgi:hypothetical protein
MVAKPSTLTREQILNRKLGRETVELPGGGSVLVRGLTRKEAIAVQEQKTTEDRDNVMISCGMVQPTMSVDDVQAWADTDAAGTMNVVSEAIARLSGMLEDSGKEAYKSPR